MEARLNAKIDANEAKMDAKFNAFQELLFRNETNWSVLPLPPNINPEAISAASIIPKVKQMFDESNQNLNELRAEVGEMKNKKLVLKARVKNECLVVCFNLGL